MATQRLIVATLAGKAATVVADLFRSWSTHEDPLTIDRFCDRLRENSASLPVVYYSEWMDRWLMGNLVPGPGAVQGAHYQLACLFPEQARAWADGCGRQFSEQEWFASRLREAAEGWGMPEEHNVVVVVRKTFGPSDTDEEVRASLGTVPAWLALTE